MPNPSKNVNYVGNGLINRLLSFIYISVVKRWIWSSTMALSRKIDWTAAMRDMRSDRAKPITPGFLASRSLAMARLDRLARDAAATPFVAAGSYDRSAIMTAALAQARAQRAKGSKAPWSQLVGAALRFVCPRARAVRIAGAH
jgi:hypothetical protein